MSRMTTIPLSGTTDTAGAGVATCTVETDYPVRGLVHGVFLDAHASAPATTDVTVRTKGGGSGGLPSYNVWTRSNVATDANVFPAVVPVDTANAAITNAHRPVPVCDVLEFVVAQANNSQLFSVWLLVELMDG